MDAAFSAKDGKSNYNLYVVENNFPIVLGAH